MQVEISPNPALSALLRAHPKIRAVRETDMEAAVAWSQDDWARSIYVGSVDIPLRGVVELMDNNPLVCADSFSLPGPAATLATIAIGPLAEAGLIVERPTMLVNVEAEEEDIAPFLEVFGWREGLTVCGQPTDLAGVVAATVICAIKTPDRLDDLDDLYSERYARSFFVRLDDSPEWHAKNVAGKPYALYRLRIAPDEPHSLLTVQIMADQEGKCGAAQIVHAMNVMCGFEESLGIADS